MEKLKGGILITPKDIEVITGYSSRVASREHLFVRDALGKTGKRLTVKEYCDFYELDYDEVVEIINPYR